MSLARRRRALRGAVLTAAATVLAAFLVAPAAHADPASAATTEASPTSSDPVTEPTATSAAPTEVASPSGSPPPSTEAAPAPVTASEVASVTGAAPPADGPDVLPGDTVVGQLMQAWPDPTAEEHLHEAHDDHAHDGEDHAEEPLSWIEPTDGEVVRVPTDALPDVQVGSVLAVTVGDELADEASVEQGFQPAVEVQSATVVDAAAPDPTSASVGSSPTNNVTAVLALPAGSTPDSTTIGTVVSVLNGAVSSFWDEQSNGTVRIAATQGAAGWVSSAQSCSNAFALWNDVAAQIGWTGGPGKHLMLYVPSNAPGCAYGLGTVGSSIGSGGRSYVQAAALSVMAHELGHNFGLGHSSELQCDGAIESGSCQTRAYYDFYDVMGISWGQVGSLNAAQATRLGLLPTSEQVALAASSAATTVTLAPVSASSGTRTVKLTASDGTVYYLEYRQPSGQDAWLGDSRNVYRLDSGVVLRRASSGADTSLLLDGSPSGSSGWSSDLQQALPVGRDVSIANGTFTVSVTATSSAGATVRTVPAAAQAPISSSTLAADQALAAGASLVSPNGSYRLAVQGDGNVVVYGPGNAVVWTTRTAGADAGLRMQSDGNVVLYGAGLRVLWNSETGGNAGARLVLQSDGNLVLYSSANRPLWWPSKVPVQLRAGQQVNTGGALVSPSGGYRLVVQPDGNAVVYGPGRVAWASMTGGPGSRLLMQGDGNLVLYRADGVPLWNSGTGGQPGARVAMQDDGNLVVYAEGGAPLWWSAR